MLSFITAVEINVHNFHLRLSGAQTNKTRQTNIHNDTRIHLHRGGGGGDFHIEGDGDVPLDRVCFRGHQY